ncbi:MAG: hypothetical protein ACUVQ8_08220 [Nitrososphaeria archaeon]
MGDARLVLKEIIGYFLERVERKGIKSTMLEMIETKKRKFEALVEEECRTVSTPIKTKTIVRELNKVFGKETILVNENRM